MAAVKEITMVICHQPEIPYQHKNSLVDKVNDAKEQCDKLK